jgi:hypothetical protein
MVNTIVAQGQVNIGDKTFAYAYLREGVYRLTGHKIEMHAVHVGGGVYRLQMVGGGKLRNHAMRTLNVNEQGQLVTAS